VQQSRGGPACSASIAIRRSGTNAFEQAENAPHRRDAIQRRDEVHFRSAGIHETGVDAIGNQCVKKDFRSGGHFTHYVGSSVW
jgi:hypothetical protein